MHSDVGWGGVGGAAVIAAGVRCSRLLDEQRTGGEVALLQYHRHSAAARVVTNNLMKNPKGDEWLS